MNIIQKLKSLIPGLEFSRDTHVAWRDCEQKYRDQNPKIGDSRFHDECVKEYDKRISVINEAADILSSVGENWIYLLKEYRDLVGCDYKDQHGNIYRFFGLVWGDDDLYFGMYSRQKETLLLSCVGSLEGHGFELYSEPWFAEAGFNRGKPVSELKS